MWGTKNESAHTSENDSTMASTNAMSSEANIWETERNESSNLGKWQLILSPFIWSGVLYPPALLSFSCLRSCLPSAFDSGVVCGLVSWGGHRWETSCEKTTADKRKKALSDPLRLLGLEGQKVTCKKLRICDEFVFQPFPQKYFTSLLVIKHDGVSSKICYDVFKFMVELTRPNPRKVQFTRKKIEILQILPRIWSLNIVALIHKPPLNRASFLWQLRQLQVTQDRMHWSLDWPAESMHQTMGGTKRSPPRRCSMDGFLSSMWASMGGRLYTHSKTHSF